MGTGEKTRIEFSEMLGRRVRIGDWQDQTIGTYVKIGEAIREGDWDHAADLADYFVDEANVCFTLYRQWVNDLRGFLADNGMDADELAATDADVQSKLTTPEGDAWNAHRHWDSFRTHQRNLLKHIYRAETGEALETLDVMKETWRQTHDRDVDHTYGLMSEIYERHGGPGLVDMYDVVLIPLFAWRYQKFDIDQHPWDEALETLMLVACESMRGHLVGPERTGDFELIETDDRFILRFDPCASGQRTIRGDWVEGTPPRMEPPLQLGGQQGGGLVEPLHEGHLPLLRPLHHPDGGDAHGSLRLPRPGPIDPPVYPGHRSGSGRSPAVPVGPCSRTPPQVPEEYYTSASGGRSPSVFGSSNFQAIPANCPTPDHSDCPEPGEVGAVQAAVLHRLRLGPSRLADLPDPKLRVRARMVVDIRGVRGVRKRHLPPARAASTSVLPVVPGHEASGGVTGTRRVGRRRVLGRAWAGTPVAPLLHRPLRVRAVCAGAGG